MSIALHSAHLATRTFLAGGDAESYQRQLAGELRRSLVSSTFISRSVLSMPYLVELAGLVPQILRLIARGTRVPTYALLKGAENPNGVVN